VAATVEWIAASREFGGVPSSGWRAGWAWLGSGKIFGVRRDALDVSVRSLRDA
jgi:hypothetical protein